jgi:hypothetical protein
MTMSLAGFDHAFADSIERELAPDLRIRVVPLPVLALLKIFAFMDNPHAHQKDIEDFVELLQRYEQEGDRRFSDEVVDLEGGALLSLRGRLPIDSAPDLRGRLLATLNRESLPVLTVDLAEVTYLDVAGSATLVE